MSGGGTQTTTQTANAEPWSAAQPALKLGLKDAQSLYKAGVGGQPYTGSTVVPYAQQSMAGFQDIQDTSAGAMGPDNPFARGFSAVGDIAEGGYNQYQNQALGNLSRTASGEDVFGANPQFQDLLKQSQDAARNAVNMNASAGGRYGSGAHQGVLAREIGDLTSRMYSDEYNRQLGRMDRATDGLFNAGQTGVTNQMDATASLPGAFTGQFAPANAMIGVGSRFEDLAGRTMDDHMRIFNETQNLPWDQLGRLNAVAGGAGQYGTTTNTAQMPRQNNMFGNIAGGILGANSLLGGGLFG
ncbi:MAG: hypothetical protein GY807_20525 [Gammaproteobacteria bacterium]|nr:hypothetical protein [Gammaproteobacteria bacterium]